MRLKNRFFSFPPIGGEKYLRPQTDARTVFRYERAISREYRPRLFPKRKEEKFSPEIYGGRRSENHLFSATLSDGQKGQY